MDDMIAIAIVPEFLLDEKRAHKGYKKTRKLSSGEAGVSSEAHLSARSAQQQLSHSTTKSYIQTEYAHNPQQTPTRSNFAPQHDTIRRDYINPIPEKHPQRQRLTLGVA